jgi:predicted DNA-binding protein
MPIRIEVKPEIEERLGREAEALGMSVEAYVEDLIERQISGHNEGTYRVDMEEIDRVLDALSEGSEDRPAPPPEAYAREGIYRDHD